MRGSSSRSEASESYPSPGEKGRFLGRGGSGLSLSLGVLRSGVRGALSREGGRVVLMMGLGFVVVVLLLLLLLPVRGGGLAGLEEGVEGGLLVDAAVEDDDAAVGGLRFLKRILGTVLGEGTAPPPEVVGVDGGGRRAGGSYSSSSCCCGAPGGAGTGLSVLCGFEGAGVDFEFYHCGGRGGGGSQRAGGKSGWFGGGGGSCNWW